MAGNGLSLFFYIIRNSSGIPGDTKNVLRGSHCGGREDAAEAARRRRRILRAEFFILRTRGSRRLSRRRQPWSWYGNCAAKSGTGNGSLIHWTRDSWISGSGK